MLSTPEQSVGCQQIEQIDDVRSEEHTSELQSRPHLVCRLLLEKKKKSNRECTPGITCDSRCFFFNQPPPPVLYTLSLHDALPIWLRARSLVSASGNALRPRITSSPLSFSVTHPCSVRPSSPWDVSKSSK